MRLSGLMLHSLRPGLAAMVLTPAHAGAAFRNESALEKLELEGNYLTGTLPRALCSLSNLTRLSLSHNQLTGEPLLARLGLAQSSQPARSRSC